MLGTHAIQNWWLKHIHLIKWRNRTEFFTGRKAIIDFLRRKWAKELDYHLMKELWCYTGNRISVRFEYEWRDASNPVQLMHTHGNEHWEFDDNGLMRIRDMSANDYPIQESDRWYKKSHMFEDKTVYQPTVSKEQIYTNIQKS